MRLYIRKRNFRSYSVIRPEAINYLLLQIYEKINTSDFRSFGTMRFKRDIAKFSYSLNSMNRDHALECRYKKSEITLIRSLYYMFPKIGSLEGDHSRNMSCRYLRVHKRLSKKTHLVITRYPCIKKRMKLKIGSVYIYLNKFRKGVSEE